MRRASCRVWLVAVVVLSGCGGPRPTVPDQSRPAPAVPPAPGIETPAPAARQPEQPPGRELAREPALEITFDDIKLDMKKGDPFTRDLLPKRVTELERRPVRIRGYILPSFQQTGITQFVLVRDNQECCFGPGAALHDCIVVRMRPGRSTTFSLRPVAVAGTFRLDELRGPDGKHLAIYALDGDEVR